MAAADERKIVVVHRPGEWSQNRYEDDRKRIGIELLARQSRREPDRERGGKPDSDKEDVDAAVRQRRSRMPLDGGPKPREQQIERRRMVEVVRLAGEAEALGIEQPHRLQHGPHVARALEVRHVGEVRDLVEPLGDILALRRDSGCHDEQRDDDGERDWVRTRPAARSERWCREDVEARHQGNMGYRLLIFR